MSRRDEGDCFALESVKLGKWMGKTIDMLVVKKSGMRAFRVSFGITEYKVLFGKKRGHSGGSGQFAPGGDVV